MGWEGLDRRQFPRVVYPCLVKVVCKDGSQETMLTHTDNIGGGGVSITVKKEIKLFTPVELEIDLVDINEHMRAKGKVVWSIRRKAIETVKPLFYDVGIEFSEIDAKDKERVFLTIEGLTKKGAKQLKPFI